MTAGPLDAVAALLLIGAGVVLLAGFVALHRRFAVLGAELDDIVAAGEISADQVATLRGDVARRRAVAAVRGQQVDLLQTALDLALDELAARGREVDPLGEALDSALAASDAAETRHAGELAANLAAWQDLWRSVPSIEGRVS